MEIILIYALLATILAFYLMYKVSSERDARRADADRLVRENIDNERGLTRKYEKEKTDLYDRFSLERERLSDKYQAKIDALEDKLLKTRGFSPVNDSPAPPELRIIETSLQRNARIKRESKYAD